MTSETTDDQFHAVREYARKIRQSKLNFNSEHIHIANNYYVGWVDLMGAGHVMGTSVQKSANILARLHMAADSARVDMSFSGKFLPINDGLFIFCDKKKDIISIIGRIFILLSANFIAVPRPHDRFLLRGGIAYGPVYSGVDLIPGLKTRKKQGSISFLDHVMFGPALIQAYRGEALAPPYGVAIHESARAFCPSGEQPFRMTHWMWWAPNEEVNYPKSLAPLPDLKECLQSELKEHFSWMIKTKIYHGLERDKIIKWKEMCEEYFSLC